MLERLHHLALGTQDVEGLAAFYRSAFGLPERARHLDEQGVLRSIWLELGTALLMVERTLSAPRRVDGIGSGLFLIAFRVSATERAALERTLEGLGHAIEGRTPFTSYCRDPDGNRIALSHYPEPAPDLTDNVDS
jgi:glyoxylase I family protein